MIIEIEKLKKIPISVKNGLSLWLIAWIWLIYSISSYYDKTFLTKFIIGGIILFVCIAQFKKWAWVLALLCNGLTILYCAFFAVIFYLDGNNFQIAVVSAVNVLLFAFSSYFLLQKTSADFFRTKDLIKSD